MAITAPNAPTTAAYGTTAGLQTSTAKTGAHTHTCLMGHVFTCTYTTACGLEMIVGALCYIVELCPVCHNFKYGKYAS